MRLPWTVSLGPEVRARPRVAERQALQSVVEEGQEVLVGQEIAERAMIRVQWDISKADVFLEQEERRLWER